MIAGRLVVESFDLGAVAEVKRLAPGLRAAALFERALRRPLLSTRELIARARGCGADEIALHRSLVTQRRVEAARSEGLPVIVLDCRSHGFGAALRVSSVARTHHQPARADAARAR